MSKLLKWLQSNRPEVPLTAEYDDISKGVIDKVIELPWQTNIISVDNNAYEWLKTNYENHFDWAVGGRYVDAGIHGGFFGKTVLRTQRKGMAVTVYTLRKPFNDRLWVKSFHDYYGFTQEQYIAKIEEISKMSEEDRARDTILTCLAILKG